MPSKKEFQSLTLEQMDEELLRRLNDLDEAKNELRVLRAVRDEKAIQEETERSLDTMSDTQLRALQQAVQARGIDSEEKLGIPGRS
jgi:hypothetical protein